MCNVNNKLKGMLFDLLTQIFDNPPKVSAEKILNSGIIEPNNICNILSKEDYNNILTIIEKIEKKQYLNQKKQIKYKFIVLYQI